MTIKSYKEKYGKEVPHKESLKRKTKKNQLVEKLNEKQRVWLDAQRRFEDWREAQGLESNLSRPNPIEQVQDMDQYNLVRPEDRTQQYMDRRDSLSIPEELRKEIDLIIRDYQNDGDVLRLEKEAERVKQKYREKYIRQQQWRLKRNK